MRLRNCSDSRSNVPIAGSQLTLPKVPPGIKEAPQAPLKFRYTTMVIRFDRKSFALRNDDLLQGLAEESASRITQLGNEGWELEEQCSPAHRGELGFVFGGKISTADSAIAFFKRPA